MPNGVKTVQSSITPFESAVERSGAANTGLEAPLNRLALVQHMVPSVFLLGLAIDAHSPPISELVGDLNMYLLSTCRMLQIELQIEIAQVP